MELVNPNTSFTWTGALDINGVAMSGLVEKQGIAFSRHGYLEAKSHGGDADAIGRAIRARHRPLSHSVLSSARDEYVRKEVPSFPRYFIIEPTAYCNRKCFFCPITVTNRYGAKMKWEHFEKLMWECRGQNVYGLSLYQLGESLLYKDKRKGDVDVDIADMVDLAKVVGFKAVNISTNGDVPNLDILLGCGLSDLLFSIDGTTPEVYSENRPSTKSNDPDAFNRTVERTRAFLELKAQSGESDPWCRLQIINNHLTAPQILDFIRYWIEVPGVDDILVKHLDSMGAWLGNTVVSEEESSQKRERVKNMPCQHLWAIGSMTATGQLNGCCHDALTELTTADANIEKMTFSEWWNGDYMNTLRTEHMGLEHGGKLRTPCANCLERDPWL